jgi:uncharacterized BrkB/YihY/UPF0761 family membrane protein
VATDDDDRSLRARATTRVDELRELTEAVWARSVAIVPVLDLGAEFIGRFNRLNGSVLVGHVAYRTFMWIIPLLLVAIGLLGQGVASGIDLIQYGEQAGLSESMLDTTGEEASGSALSILLVGGVALVLATRSLLRALILVFAQAWETEAGRPRKIVRAIGWTLFGAIVVVAGMALINTLAGKGPVLLIGAGLMGLAINSLLLLGVSWFLPHRCPTVFGLVPGVALAMVGVTLMNVLGGLYFPRRLTEASETYGAIGFTLVSLFYLWLWAFLIVVSAFVNTVWCDRSQILDGRPFVASPELLPPWVRRMLPHRLGGELGAPPADDDTAPQG